MSEIPVTNKSTELSDCKDAWFFHEKYRVWCLEDILYTEKATVPEFQRLSIFVPEAYMKEKGEIDPEGVMNGYTADTAPVIFENNSAGYMQMPHVRLDGPGCHAYPYLAQGYVYVTCGNRGHESRDADGRFCGKAPINLVDLKTCVRFIRHNRASIPGDMTKIISIGCSAGGAMSTLLAVTGDNANFIPYLEENGAFMEESDAVYASQIYCPIIDLEHADLAYEWLFGADKENVPPVGPRGVMSPFQEELSAILSKDYIEYFNSLELKNPENGEKLEIGEDGRSGSGLGYLMEKLNESATIYLTKLKKGELPEKYSVEDYLDGNYTYGAPAGAHTPVPPTAEARGKRAWLSWDGDRAVISDIDSYVLNYRRRMKPCTSFDVLGMDSGENKVFGNANIPMRHFNTYIAAAIDKLKDRFPEEYAKYHEGYARVLGDEELARQVYLINPFRYIKTEEKSAQAEYYRIRVGTCDADTSFTVSMILACLLAEAGKEVDYQLVWDQPHCEADYPGEVIAWIEEIVKKA